MLYKPWPTINEMVDYLMSFGKINVNLVQYLKEFEDVEVDEEFGEEYIIKTFFFIMGIGYDYKKRRIWQHNVIINGKKEMTQKEKTEMYITNSFYNKD